MNEIRKEHIVNCNGVPEVFAGWEIEEHRKMGKIYLEICYGQRFVDGEQLFVDGWPVTRYLSEEQKDNKLILGHDLRKELTNKFVLNASILDYLVKNPELIPNWSWTALTYFWGTIFRNPQDSRLYVPFLFRNGGKWTWECNCLDSTWGNRGLAACLHR